MQVNGVFNKKIGEILVSPLPFQSSQSHSKSKNNINSRQITDWIFNVFSGCLIKTRSKFQRTHLRLVLKQFVERLGMLKAQPVRNFANGQVGR